MAFGALSKEFLIIPAGCLPAGTQSTGMRIIKIFKLRVSFAMAQNAVWSDLWSLVGCGLRP